MEIGYFTRIGDFARTRWGDLGKITCLEEGIVKIKIHENLFINVVEGGILISSKDLFDVLFAGDYINGREGGRIKAKVTDQNGKYFLVGHNGIYYPKDVTQVVTAEKYKKLKELKQAAKDFEKKATYIL